MKKRLLSLFLTLALALTMVPILSAPASAANGTAYAVSGGYIYYTKSNGTITITSATASVTAANIPAKIEGIPVKKIADSAFRNNKNLLSVTLPNGITSIGAEAFIGCTKLTTVNLPNTLTEIGSGTFSQCSSLKSISLPASIKAIPNNAFCICTNLTNVTLPYGITSIGRQAFDRCSSLKSVTIPASVTQIGEKAFAGCTSLASLSLPKGITVVPASLCDGCTSLKSVTIPGSVTTIKKEAFANCSSLTGITIPNSVTVIEKSAFYDCSSLSNVKLPNRLKEISSATFWGCESLTKITIPASVSSIGSNAFLSCSNLKAAYFRGHAPESLGSSAFKNTASSFIMYYPEWALAWSYPTWNGYNTKPYKCYLDVDEDSWYTHPVAWAVDNGITGGTSDRTFSPNQQCTRAQAVTFLWAMAGKPEPRNSRNPFVDVKQGDWYYKAVLWAVEKGITSGTDASHFSPNAKVTREQFVTFLYAYAGRPSIWYGQTPFKDVPSGKWYTTAVFWAVSQGITSGVDSNHFGTGNICTRAQVVTFLYAYAH